MNIPNYVSLLVICFLIKNADQTATNIIDIIGGVVTEINKFPYQVSLRSKNQFFCGGIIIDTRHILTAAHCVCDTNYTNCPVSTNGLTIVAGSSTLRTISSGGVQIPVQKIFVHEKYVSRTIFANDIAVLRLSKELKFSTRIEAYPLADSTPREGTECTVTGWGTTSIIGTIPNILMYVNTSIIGHNSCALLNNVHYKILCTDRGGKQPYKGDSSGALNCGGEIAGIVSAGYPLDIFPIFFTDIAQYKTWIDIQLKRETSTAVEFNFSYYILLLITTNVYSFVRRFLYFLTLPFNVFINTIQRIFPWLF